MTIMEKQMKEKRHSNSLLENVKIRDFVDEDGEDIRRIYADSMLSNVPYALSSTMQHRHILCLWIGLTYFTVKNHSASRITLMIIVFIGWGIFLYVNANRFITNLISYETRQVILRELSKVKEYYSTKPQSLYNVVTTKPEKQHKDHSSIIDSHSVYGELLPFKFNDQISKFWVAVDKRSGNRVIGFLALRDDETKRRKIQEHEPQIKYLCVDTNYMRQGVATLLMQHAIKFAYKRKVMRIGVTASTWHEPAAEMFYRFGFREVMREAINYGLAEKVKLSLDVESWIRYRKARKLCSS
ncbi:13043_t:CDS:2 [Acaulospora morrowiae]|uniref:13043_t:CDS:1 n=1 Tax=Acaulospora morrowiae TaxID=94023 RepID=A0A9N9EF70_9GLOM|nr:13043_t:CDS:2 [Acaulospora morrowiae]